MFCQNRTRNSLRGIVSRSFSTLQIPFEACTLELTLQGNPIPKSSATAHRLPGAIVANSFYLAFHDPTQFRNLAVPLLLFALGLPAYLFWRRRSLS